MKGLWLLKNNPKRSDLELDQPCNRAFGMSRDRSNVMFTLVPCSSNQPLTMIVAFGDCVLLLFPHVMAIPDSCFGDALASYIDVHVCVVSPYTSCEEVICKREKGQKRQTFLGRKSESGLTYKAVAFSSLKYNEQ